MGEVKTWRDRPWLYAIYWWWLGVRGSTRHFLRRLGVLPPLTEEQKMAIMPRLADEFFTESPLICKELRKKHRRPGGKGRSLKTWAK